MLKEITIIINLSLIITLFGSIILQIEKKDKKNFFDNGNLLTTKKRDDEIILSSETSKIVYSYYVVSERMKLEEIISKNIFRKISSYNWYAIKLDNNINFIAADVSNLNDYSDDKMITGIYVNRSRNLVIGNGITKSTIIKYNNENEKVNFFGFIPKYSGYYEIKTDLILGDPVLKIYNNSMILIAENDDYYGLNSYVKIWLFADEKYYFQVRSYPNSNSKNSTGNLIVEMR